MRKRIELVDLVAAYGELQVEIDTAIRRVCEEGAFIGGEEVRAFELEWAAFTGARHAVGVANGTDALTLTLLAAELPSGAEVIVPANTFIATAEAVVAAGLRPRFVDVEPDSGLIDLERLPVAIDGAVRAIVPVHLYGRVVDMASVMELARANGLLVVEDAAQAHAARRAGRHSGTFGDAGCFSFYPGKNLGAFGDAGAVVTDDDGLAERLRLLRDHGRRGRDEHEIVGVNSRLDALQAAVLRAKLPHLEHWTSRRRVAAQAYRRLLDPGMLDWEGDDNPEAESHHLFPILVDARDELFSRLRDAGVMVGVHYRVPVPATSAFGGRRGEFPVAEERAERQLSLPIHPHLAPAELERVADAVSELAGVAI